MTIHITLEWWMAVPAALAIFVAWSAYEDRFVTGYELAKALLFTAGASLLTGLIAQAGRCAT